MQYIKLNYLNDYWIHSVMDIHPSSSFFNLLIHFIATSFILMTFYLPMVTPTHFHFSFNDKVDSLPTNRIFLNHKNFIILPILLFLFNFFMWLILECIAILKINCAWVIGQYRVWHSIPISILPTIIVIATQKI